MTPVTVALVGAGSRGQNYAEWIAAHPDRARLVAVADPLAQRREKTGGTAYPDWQALAAEGRVADAVIIATQDRDHVAPAEAFARAGYHVLLEKPLAPTADECRRIVQAVKEAGVMLAVCHVLRYTAYTDLVKRVVDEGTAFTAQDHRQTRIFGTHGMLTGDGVRVKLHDFRTDTVTVLDSEKIGDATAGGGHGGGDAGVMDAFIAAVAAGDPSLIRSGPAESLASHLAVFAAETARHTGTVVTVDAA